MMKGTSVLVISNHDVEEVLDANETVRALEAAYRDLAKGDAICRPRIDLGIPTGESSNVYQWGTMEGGSSASGYFAIRAKSDIVVEAGSGTARTQDPGWETPAEVVRYRAQPDSAVWRDHQAGEGGGRGLSGVDPAKTIFLSDPLEGRAPGRSDAREVTYSERGNIQGAQFFAVAGRVYELARARGLGHEIPTEWFLQDIRD